MGIFGNRKILSASDAEIIMLAMILSVAADGTIEEKETKTLLGLAAQFPAFNGKDLGSLFSKGCNTIAKNGFEGAIKNIASASAELKSKAFIAAVECAYSSGDVFKAAKKPLFSKKWLRIFRSKPVSPRNALRFSKQNTADPICAIQPCRS